MRATRVNVELERPNKVRVVADTVRLYVEKVACAISLLRTQLSRRSLRRGQQDRDGSRAANVGAEIRAPLRLARHQAHAVRSARQSFHCPRADAFARARKRGCQHLPARACRTTRTGPEQRATALRSPRIRRESQTAAVARRRSNASGSAHGQR